MNKKMPTWFIGHGSPLNIILDNDFTRSLKAWGKRLPRPQAIMVISAHWLTDGTYVGCMEKPKIIHDFYGFPRELYKITYPSPGAPIEAMFATEVIRKVPVRCSREWGLDHASWAILKHLYPKADVPVFEMSLDYTFNDWRPKPIQHHYDLAKEMAELRNRGVLIIGSGNIVHNLGILDFENIDADPLDWAKEFDERIKASLLSGNESYDLWEERRGILSFTTGAVFGGLAAASLFCKIFGEEENAARYQEAAAEIRDAASTHLWREELNRFCRMIYRNGNGTIQADPTCDSSLWGLFAFGLIPWITRRWSPLSKSCEKGSG